MRAAWYERKGEAGAGITAHRAVFADGPVTDKVVLVAGAAGAVGSIAAHLAAWGGARVIGTVRIPAP